MSNNAFKTHTVNTMFMLSLSKRQINSLLAMQEDDKRALLAVCPIASYRKLIEKGLASFEDDKGFSLTRAGELVCDLLREAGFVNELKTHAVGAWADYASATAFAA